jgi:hypothetical protein
VIKAVDAGWIYKSPEGRAFLTSLSETDNMNYFEIEVIRTIIKF